MITDAQKAIYDRLVEFAPLGDSLAQAPWGGPAIYDTSAPRQAVSPYMVLSWASVTENYDTQVVADLDVALVEERGEDSFSRATVFDAASLVVSALDRMRVHQDGLNLRLFFTGAQTSPDASARVARVILQFEARFNRRLP